MAANFPNLLEGIIPPILPGETVVSHCMRISMLTGASFRRVMQCACDYTSYERLNPVQLGRYMQNLPHLKLDSRKLLQRHTPFNAVAPFKQDAIPANILDTQPEFRFIFPKSNGPRTRLASCPACVEEGIARHGFGYWRVKHQFPGVVVCPTHGEPLHYGCVHKECHSNQHAAMPGAVCAHGQVPSTCTEDFSAKELHLARRIAVLYGELLDKPIEWQPGEYWNTLYFRAAQRLGLTRDDRFDEPKLQLALSKHFGVRLMDIFELTDGKYVLEKQSLIHPYRTRAIRHIALTQFFFDSWEAARKARHPEGELAHASNKTRSWFKSSYRMVLVRKDHLRLTIRNKAEQLMESDSSTDWRRLHTALGDEADWLADFDSAWLSERNIVPRSLNPLVNNCLTN